MLERGATLWHTHSPEPMLWSWTAWSARAGRCRTWSWPTTAGRAARASAGLDSVGYADCNDPALFIGEAEGTLQVTVPLDDHVPTRASTSR